MNPGDEMIELTVVKGIYPYLETKVWINRRDVFLLKRMELKDNNDIKASALLTIDRWDQKHEFYTKETAEEILKLMGRKEE